jgi:ABC-type branched-subunit amino acid transport system ATPase component
MLLRVEALTAGYGGPPIIREVSLAVDAGEIVCVIGPNRAGKSTVLRAVAGQLAPLAGRVMFDGTDVSRKSIPARSRLGMIFIPQGANIFPTLTVRENLEMAGILVPERDAAARRIDRVLQRFPFLHAKRRHPARDLSGGERQLLALSRIAITRPRLVLLDEPSLGLAPVAVDRVFAEIAAVGEQGTAVLLVEQNARMGLSVAHRGYVLELGRNRMTGRGRELLENDDVRRLYLGG